MIKEEIKRERDAGLDTLDVPRFGFLATAFW
jgi:hypothetical protein